MIRSMHGKTFCIFHGELERNQLDMKSVNWISKWTINSEHEFAFAPSRTFLYIFGASMSVVLTFAGLLCMWMPNWYRTPAGTPPLQWKDPLLSILLAGWLTPLRMPSHYVNFRLLCMHEVINFGMYQVINFLCSWLCTRYKDIYTRMFRWSPDP